MKRQKTLGFLTHLLLGATVFPGVYAAVFQLMGRAELPGGLFLGAVHGLIAGVLLPVVGRGNPCVRSRTLLRPGLFGYRYGAFTPFGLYLFHVAYGALLGYFYVVPGR
jgi:hypothetical protein